MLKVATTSTTQFDGQVRPPVLQGQVLALSSCGSSTASSASRRRAGRAGRCATAASCSTASRPHTMRKDQDFPVSIEVQFLGGNGKDERPTAQRLHAGHERRDGRQLITRHCTNSKSKTFHGDQWVTAEIEVRGRGASSTSSTASRCWSTRSRSSTSATPTRKTMPARDGKLLLDAATSRCRPRATRSSSARSSCCRSTPSVAVGRALRFMARQNPARPTTTHPAPIIVPAPRELPSLRPLEPGRPALLRSLRRRA